MIKKRTVISKTAAFKIFIDMSLIKEVNKPTVTQMIVIYGGRFQPFHRGHYAAYENLCSKFGKANVYIGTSNDTSSDKSPFTFKEKKEIATNMFGVPASKFVKVNNPYRPIEILSKYDGKITQYIAAVGEKDASRLKSPYFKPYKGKAGYGYDEVGYYYTVPAEENPISGTDVRKKLGSSNKDVAKKFFLKAYPTFDKDIFKMITTKLNEDGMPGGIGVGLILPGGYINGAPTGSVYKKNNALSELIDENDLEEIFNLFVNEYFGEAENPALDVDISYTTADGEQKKIKARNALRLPKEHPAHIQAAKIVGPEDAPVNEPKKKEEPGKAATQAAKPAEPGQPTKKDQTVQGKTDKEKPEAGAAAKPAEQGPPPEQKLSGAEYKSSAEKNAEGGKESSEEKKQRENKEKLDKEIEHEKNGLSHEEKNAYEFLDGLPDEEKAKAIDDALNKRNIIQVIAQDTVVGGFIAKKGKQLGNFIKGIGSFIKSGKTGTHKDCSGAPSGPHAKGGWSLGTHLAEDAESRRNYLSKLDATGNKPDDSKKPPVDKSKCKDTHYQDYQKRDEKGERVYEEKPVYESGKKPDPAEFHSQSGQYLSNKAKPGGKDSKEEPFNVKELDPETGYFKRDDKYYDVKGKEVDKSGNTLDANGKPTQKKNFWGSPKTQKVPVYEDGLSHEQEHAAHESHHKAHEQQHAIKHTVMEGAAILGGAMFGGAILGKLGLGHTAAATGTEAAAHGAGELAKHIIKDGIKHAGFEMMGMENIGGMAGAGLGLSAVTGGILEELYNDANMLLENNDKDANKKFFLKLLTKMAEAYKGYKMTPEQKLESLKTYKLLKVKREKEDKKKSLISLIKEDISESKKKSINHFVEYATRQLKLNERPKITLLTGRQYSEAKTSLGGYNPMSKEIYVAIEGRLTADILRTLAHEMVHRKQDELGLVKDEIKDGATGSPIENQAHAVAGILMRNYGKINKQIYNESINIDVDKGDTVLMGKFKNKKVVVKDIGKDDYGMPTINGKKAATFRLGDKGQNIFKKEVDEADRISKKPGQHARSAGKPSVVGNMNAFGPSKVLGKGGKVLGFVPDTPNVIATLIQDYPNVQAIEFKSPFFFDFNSYKSIKKGDKAWKELMSRGVDNATKAALKKDFQLKESEVNESLLLEGGAYGHMAHPFDDMDLTFGDLKDIISKALNGDLGVVREKTDGQALAISWKNGRLIAARNKGNLANAGANAMGIEDVASKFGGRGGLTDAYNFAMKDLSAAISGLSDAQRKKIFNEGKCFMNLEVIWPTSVNVIPYGQALLVFHNTVCYDEKGTATGADGGAAGTLAGMIKQVNADVQSKYTIQGPPITSIPKSDDLSSKQGKYLSRLKKLQSEFGLSDSDNVADYHQSWWDWWITSNAPIKVDKITKESLIRRWAFGDKGFRLNTISNLELQKWATTNDKVNVIKQQKDNIKPFEEIFLGVGADVLEFVGSVLTVHPEKAIRAMKQKFVSVASQVRSGGNPAQIQKLKSELERLNKLGGIEKIVASEGLVFVYNGKTYKLTGTFAPLNQILGIFYS